MSKTLEKIIRQISPRSFMARALLMIALPLLILQIVIAVLIVQRYFDEVTQQLTAAVITDIQYAEAHASNDAAFKTALGEFNYKLVGDEIISNDQFGAFDLSGRYILAKFKADYSQQTHIHSHLGELVLLQIPTRFGIKSLVIERKLLTPVNPHQILANTAFFMTLLMLVAILFLRNQVRSIRYLARAAEAFGRGETIPYYPRGAAEIRLAGRNFIAMRDRINQQREQRNLMLSGVGHDFRTPLTRFRLGLEMLDDEETRTELLGDVTDMERLIDSFLDYANNTANEDFEKIAFDRFIESAIREDASIKIAEAPKTRIAMRPLLLKRALDNLLNNAKRYGKNIEISFEETRKFIRIMIDDDGPGIPEAQRKQALIAFRRFDQSRNQDQGAHAGLGLAIAADAVRQQGGQLTLAESPQGGLRAVIELPLNLET